MKANSDLQFSQVEKCCTNGIIGPGNKILSASSRLIAAQTFFARSQTSLQSSTLFKSDLFLDKPSLLKNLSRHQNVHYGLYQRLQAGLVFDKYYKLRNNAFAYENF